MPKAEKKRIQIHGLNRPYSLNSTINFAWVSSPAEGRRQVSEFHTCRDYINDDLLSFYSQDDHRIPKEGVTIDTERFRLLIAIELSKDNYEDWKQALYNAKNIINIYEELAGFSRTSVLTRVDYTYNGKTTDKVKYCWLLTGPKEWVRYSQLVSMVTLIFRAVTRYKNADGLETIEQVEDYWRKLIEEASNACSKFRHSDSIEYLPNCWRKFHMMMKWHDRIFTLTGNQAHNEATNWHSCGGINSLCSFKTHIDGIDQPMRKAWKEWQQKYLK
ncbi:hypothetical protein DRN34_02220 [Thermococci archaeon]|nr:MAG: hypothetical protein DRN34_02220 [Thermococci archaeon]